MLGARPIGSISLTLFLAYNLFVGLSTLGILLAPDPVGFAILLVLAILGGLMFILPLNNIHKRMAAVKQNERQKLFEHFSALSGPSEDGSGDKTDNLLRSIRDAQILQFRKEFAAGIPTWPFDTSILGRFEAVVLFVTAILLSRTITVTLHL